MTPPSTDGEFMQTQDFGATAGGMGKVRARFFKHEKRDMVEISIIGDPNTVVRRVKPEDTHRFKMDWEAYESGKGEVEVPGTPLTEVPGVDTNQALAYKLRGVRVAEELAALDDAACRGIGMGALTHRNAAQNLLKAKQFDAMQKQMDDKPKRGPGRPPKDEQAA